MHDRPLPLINKILIIAPSWIGDMAISQSLFKALKENNPDVIIDVLASSWARSLLYRMPEVNQVIAMPVSHGALSWSIRRDIARKLQKYNYNQAIILPNSWKSALIPWFAKISIRSGWCGEMRYGLLNDIRSLNKMAIPMMVQRYVSLAYPASQSHIAPSYQSPYIINKYIETRLIQILTEHSHRLIICPGAEFGAAKQWPAKHYAEVINQLISEGWQILIIGSSADKDIASDIMSKITTKENKCIFNLCGKTKLQDAIDILTTADTIISNDSGLMHITAAINIPLIAIYGPTSPNFTPPLADNARILQLDIDCGPCFQKKCPERHHRCMHNISSKEVIHLIYSIKINKSNTSETTTR